MEFTNSGNTQHPQPSDSTFPAFDATIDFGPHQLPSFRMKSSKFRGVQKIKDKETYVAHVYDNGHTPKDAKTIYLGRFDDELEAARAHDLVSLKFWGTTATTNFPISEYGNALEAMETMSDHDVMVSVRRSSNSFSRGKSKYRGVVMHSNSGKWQARKGPGKDSFLGTYDTEEEAAMAFDIASIKLKGFKAVTNFDIKSYDVPAILESQPEPDQLERDDQAGNRRKKRIMGLHHFLRKQTQSQIPALSPPPAGSGGSSSSSQPETLGFSHSNSSAFRSYKQSESATLDDWSSGEREVEAPAIGFRHASSSCFKPFRGL